MEKEDRLRMSTAKKIILAAIPVAVVIAAGITVLLIFRASGAKTAGRSYIISDGNTTVTLYSEAKTPEEALSEAGFSLKNAGFEVREGGDSTLIIIVRNPTVTVACDGSETVISIAEGTVADALEAARISLGEGDAVSPPLSEKISDGMRIEVARAGE